MHNFLLILIYNKNYKHYKLLQIRYFMANQISKMPSPTTKHSPCKINIAGYTLDQFKTFNPEGYTILCNLGEICNNVQYFPNTSKIVLTSETHS